MTPVKGRVIKSAGLHKSRPYRCPVCNKRQMYALQYGEDSGRVQRCGNCGYTHKKSMMDKDPIKY